MSRPRWLNGGDQLLLAFWQERREFCAGNHSDHRLGPEVHGCGSQLPYTNISPVSVHPTPQIVPGWGTSLRQAGPTEPPQRRHARQV